MWAPGEALLDWGHRQPARAEGTSTQHLWPVDNVGAETIPTLSFSRYSLFRQVDFSFFIQILEKSIHILLQAACKGR
jgi:hypothetical protein